ncbi:hypothetical protein P3T22_002954 [Paraburkholderia sp. GAS348]
MPVVTRQTIAVSPPGHCPDSPPPQPAKSAAKVSEIVFAEMIFIPNSPDQVGRLAGRLHRAQLPVVTERPG